MMNQYTCSGCGGAVAADPAMKSSVLCSHCSMVLIMAPMGGASTFVDFQCPSCGVTNSADSAIEPEIRCSSCFGTIKLGQAQPAAAQQAAGAPAPVAQDASVPPADVPVPQPAAPDAAAQSAQASQPSPEASGTPPADTGATNTAAPAAPEASAQGAGNPLPELGGAANSGMPQLGGAANSGMPQLGGAANSGMPQLGAAAKNDMPQLGGATGDQPAPANSPTPDDASADSAQPSSIVEETGKEGTKADEPADTKEGEDTTSDEKAPDEAGEQEESTEEVREETSIDLSDSDNAPKEKKELPAWLKFFIDRPRLLIAIFGVIPVLGTVVTGVVLTFIRSGKGLANGEGDAITHGGAIVLGVIALWAMYNLVMNYYYADRDWLTDLGNFVMIAGACWGMYAIVTSMLAMAASGSVTFISTLGLLFYAYVCLAAITLAIWLLAPYKGIGKPR